MKTYALDGIHRAIAAAGHPIIRHGSGRAGVVIEQNAKQPWLVHLSCWPQTLDEQSDRAEAIGLIRATLEDERAGDTMAAALEQCLALQGLDFRRCPNRSMIRVDLAFTSLAHRKAAAPLRPAAAQQRDMTALPLFGDQRQQIDMMDLLR